MVQMPRPVDQYIIHRNNDTRPPFANQLLDSEHVVPNAARPANHQRSFREVG